MNYQQTQKIIAAGGTEKLAVSLSQKLGCDVESLKSGRFPNQELKIRLKQKTTKAILLGSFSSPVNTKIIEYILAADALKRQGSDSVIGIISYLAYSKQDKVFLSGEPLSAKVIASIIQTGPFDRLYTLDLHNPSISGYFDIPVINLTAVNALADTAKTSLLPDSIVVSPDAGSIKNANKFAELVDLPLTFATKHRNLETGSVTFQEISSNIAHKNIYIYDDMIATGNTLIELAEFLHQKGAKSINIFCTHHLFINGVQERLNQSPIDHLTITNSIQMPDNTIADRLSVIDISSVFANQLLSESNHD